MIQLPKQVIGAGLVMAAMFAAPAANADLPPKGENVTTHAQPPSTAEYRKAVAKTAGMVSSPAALLLARRFGLSILNLTWEDTGRYKDSSVGPNISDMTIQVASRDPRSKALDVTCMPVIRYPNFSDKTGDIDPRDFTLLIGNQTPGSAATPLQRISLYDFLEHPTAYLTQPQQWKAPHKSLLAPERDSKVLVSAQACFLPVPREGKAAFNPVLFNYQSYAQNPAVLTVLATREGTSATIIDNTRDAFSTGSVWGQRLFHNAHGQRASLTGERESDFRAHSPARDGGPAVAKTESGLNMVLLIQIPLKQKERSYELLGGTSYMKTAAASPMMRQRAASNVENAVIGHGETEGVYTETDDIPIERDARFPVRVTVQFYKATDNGVVSRDDMAAIKAQIDRVYAHSDSVGSLITGGETGRVTEYDGAKVEPADWWERFWLRREHETGETREQILARLHALLGDSYEQRPVTDLYLRDRLRQNK